MYTCIYSSLHVGLTTAVPKTADHGSLRECQFASPSPDFPADTIDVNRTEWTVLHWNAFFLKRFITQTVYTRCTKINYKIVPVTNFNKYVLYGTSGNE